MARVVWKGAIVFGLVHIPVDLYPGSRSNDLDFDGVDRRDNAPVGYQRINKSTGKPVAMADIVKGYEYSDGQYVLLSDEDFRLANPKATQTVEILAFVDAASIGPEYFETPYRLAPGKRGEKGYALLRETLKRTGKVGVAQVVIRTKQHLAIVMPDDDLLRLETLRYADEVLANEDLELPAKSSVKITDKELDLAERLVEDMSDDWDPSHYRDTYRDDLMQRIEQKVKSGETEVLAEPGEAPETTRGAQVIDLMAALKRSLEEGGRGQKGGRRPPARAEGPKDGGEAKPAARKSSRKATAKAKAPARRTAAKTRKRA